MQDRDFCHLLQPNRTPGTGTSEEPADRAKRKPLSTVLLCGSSVRSLAEACADAGLRTLCVDFFQDADLTTVIRRTGGRFVGRIRCWSQLPAVTRCVHRSIPMIWAGGLENHPDVLKRINRRRPLIGTSLKSLTQVRDQQFLREALSGTDVHFPEIADHTNARPGVAWIRKPRFGSGGIGIRLTNENLQCGSPPEVLSSSNRSESYLQQFVDGVPMSAIFCRSGPVVRMFGMTLQIIGWPSLGAGDFLFCGNLGPVDPGSRPREALLQAAAMICRTTGLTGVFGVDFILRQGEVWILEVNPRLTAAHLIFDRFPAQTPSLICEHLQACGYALQRRRSGKARKLFQQRAAIPGSAAAVRFVLWAKHGYFLRTLDLQRLRIRNPRFRIADISEFGCRISSNQPVCSIEGTADTMQQLVRDLADAETSGKHSEYSWPHIASETELLLQRFEQNRSQ